MITETVVTEPVTDISGLSFGDLRDVMAGKEVKVPEKEPSEVAEEKPVAESIAVESDTTKKEEVDPEEAEVKALPEGGNLKKRFSKLTTKIHGLEAENARLKASAVPEVKQAVVTPEPVKIEAAPTQAEFPDWEDYQAALVRHEVRKLRAEDAKAESDRAAQAEQSALETRLNQQTTEARGKHADFDAIALNPQLPVTPVMLHVLQSSDNGAELLYHLGKNPDVSASIAAMSPGAAALAIGKLEAKLFPDEVPEPVAAPVPVAPKVLPKPPAIVGGTAAPVKADLSDDSLPFSDFKALYFKSLKKK